MTTDLAVGGLFAGVVLVRFSAMLRKRPVERGERFAWWTTAAMFLCIAAVYLGTAAEYFLDDRAIRWEFAAAGALLYAAGVTLRFVAIRTLGRYFSTFVEIRDEHRLVRDGPFRFMRHPNYAGLILEVAGFPLLFNAWITLMLGVALFLPIVMARIDVEERMMVEKFGEAYAEYRREVFGLIPLKKRRIS